MFLQIALIAVLVAGIACLFWTLVRQSSVKIERQYALLAENLGLELNQPPPQMGGFLRPEPSVFGTYRGRELSVSAPGKGMQNTRQVETVLKVELRASRISAQLAPTGMLGGLRQRDSGGKLRWRSGDTDFDEAVDIRTDTGEHLEPILTKERRAWLLRQLKVSKATVYIGSGNLAYVEYGLITDDSGRERIEEVAEFFCDLADEIEGKS